MLAFTRETLPSVLRHLDFLNVMAYDMMNRRDATTKHHSGITLASAAIDAYVARKPPPPCSTWALPLCEVVRDGARGV